MTAAGDQPPYPVGLRLAERRVVVVGAGSVCQRRLPTLLMAGARVVVVSPQVRPAIEAMVASGEVSLLHRTYRHGDLEGAWYALATTDDPAVNAAVVSEAEQRRIFCVRADDAIQGSAWTPASGRHDEVTVAVTSNRDPRRSAAIRDSILKALRDGRLTDPHRSAREPGVVLVGGGPGDPELITLAGRRALFEADVVVADRLAPRALLDELPPQVEIVDVSKLPRGRSASQPAINELCISRALAGQRVARFKGGDSFVFGRGYEEALACEAAGVPWSVVPGITSAISVPAAAGIPVTHRGVAHEVTIVSGHLPPGHADSLVSWPALGQLRGTIVLLMAVQNLTAIASALIEHGRRADTPVAVVQEGTMPGEQRVLSTLHAVGAAVAERGIRPPAIVVVGGVVAVAHPTRTRS
ncbi:MAG: uroporphyrinogen-III C-methyltransferase [Actinomycetota bacterium]|nr:uroporphyrinogen-III C-methyltransferase [Actinomycetota bacterium]